MSVVNVYGYEVRYVCKDNGKKLFFISDIIRQYNEKNGTNKDIRECFKTKDTEEMIKIIAVHGCGVFPSSVSNSKNNRKYVKDVIEYISFNYGQKVTSGYGVCLDLLHYILNWVDIEFGYTVWHYLSEEFEKGSDVTKKLHDNYIKSQETISKQNEEIQSLKQEIKEIEEKVERDTNAQYCDQNLDKYIVYIRQKDSETLEVKKLSKKYNKKGYKKYLFDHFCDKYTREEIEEAIKNNEEPEFNEADLTIVYSKNCGIGESLKRHIILSLKEKLINCPSIKKITLNKIHFNRPITIDDIYYIRSLCKNIRYDMFTYHVE